jgi:hypothetical protein
MKVLKKLNILIQKLVGAVANDAPSMDDKNSSFSLLIVEDVKIQQAPVY